MNMELRLSWTDVRDEIRTRILSRTYAPGDKLPRDEDIAAELGCARTRCTAQCKPFHWPGLSSASARVARMSVPIQCHAQPLKYRSPGAKWNYEGPSTIISSSAANLSKARSPSWQGSEFSVLSKCCTLWRYTLQIIGHTFSKIVGLMSVRRQIFLTLI